mgnify:CR=1 FL=1
MMKNKLYLFVFPIISAIVLFVGIFFLVSPINNEEQTQESDAAYFEITVKTAYRTSSSDVTYSTKTSYATTASRFHIYWRTEGGGTGNWGANGHTLDWKGANGYSGTKGDGSLTNVAYAYYNWGGPVMGIGGPYYRYMVVDPYNNASSTARCFGVSTSTSNKANRSTNISVRYFYNGTVYNSESDARTACKRQASWSGTVYVIYRKKYTLSFNANGGSGAPSSKTVYAGIGAYIPTTKPSRTGYTFLGWSTSSSATSATWEAGDTMADRNAGQNRTLYAVWKANTYNISYNLDNGSKNGSYWPTTATYNSAFNVSNPTRTGYSFRGWTATGINTSTAKYGDTKSSATNSWTSGTTLVYYASYMGFNNLTSTNNGTVTLKANWEANGYTLTMNANGGSISSNSNWTGSGASATKTVKYDSQYGTLPTSSNISRTGYTFDNWWTSGSGGSRVYTTTKMNSTSGATIYAHWTPNIYKITLDKQSGSGGTNEIYLKYNTAWCSNSSGTATITSITKPTRTGYTFGGYYTDKNGTGTQIINASGSITGSKTYIASADTLYAKWTANTYSIVFDKNGGSGSMSNQSMTYDKASNLTTNTYTRQGYYFVGWSKTKLGVQSTIPTSNIYKDEASVNNLATSGSITLYAVWLDTWANHATTPTGSGSSTSPYIIDSAEDLAWMINNHGSALKYFKQTKAINLSKYNWYPIGTSDKPFKGVYDGQGYEITNLNILEITNASGNKIQSDIGLFGYTSGGEITGIYIKNATIYGKDNVGLIVSNATSTKINSNIIESSTINASGNYGAVAGKISGGEIKYNLVYVTTNGGTSTSSLYTGSTTLSTNLVENNGTRSKVGTEDLTGWGKVFNRLLPSAISWGAQVLPATSSDLTNWVNKTIN